MFRQCLLSVTVLVLNSNPDDNIAKQSFQANGNMEGINFKMSASTTALAALAGRALNHGANERGVLGCRVRYNWNQPPPFNPAIKVGHCCQYAPRFRQTVPPKFLSLLCSPNGTPTLVPDVNLSLSHSFASFHVILGGN